MTVFTPLRAPAIALPSRPLNLIRAAHAGQSGWQRHRHLPKLMRLGYCPRPGAAMSYLLTEETKQNEARKLRAPSYDIQRHVLLMIAILAEYRTMSQQVISAPGTATPKHP